MRAGRYLVVLLLGLALVAAGTAAAWLHRPLAMGTPTVEVDVELGKTPREIAQAWVQGGVQTSPLLLYEWFRWSGQARKIRAGSYELQAGATPIDLLNMMIRGDETLAVVKLIEGWTFRQFRAELAKADGLKPTTREMSDADVMAALGEPAVPPEGRFYPDSYSYSKGSADLAVLKRAHRAMKRQLEAAWAERASDLPLKTPDDALTLASIVEKETGVAADRPRIAAVFINRLKVDMPLQTDPSVIYGLGSAFDGNLRKRDLQADTPYNTYTRGGLPPTPIAMPGKAALLAAVRPDSTKALYFVSRGDGSSHFSETLPEHNRAVNQYQRNTK
jgi:UPF0755 protein